MLDIGDKNWIGTQSLSKSGTGIELGSGMVIESRRVLLPM